MAHVSSAKLWWLSEKNWRSVRSLGRALAPSIDRRAVGLERVDRLPALPPTHKAQFHWWNPIRFNFHLLTPLHFSFYTSVCVRARVCTLACVCVCFSSQTCLETIEGCLQAFHESQNKGFFSFPVFFYMTSNLLSHC